MKPSPTLVWNKFDSTNMKESQLLTWFASRIWEEETAKNDRDNNPGLLYISSSESDTRISAVTFMTQIAQHCWARFSLFTSNKNPSNCYSPLPHCRQGWPYGRWKPNLLITISLHNNQDSRVFRRGEWRREDNLQAPSKQFCFQFSNILLQKQTYFLR